MPAESDEEEAAALVDATELNGLGGEWKTVVTVGNPIDLKTRFFQPLTYRTHLFLSPYAGWKQDLAQVFDHVFMDLGLTVHNTGALSTGVLRETLELVPFGKLLFSTDGKKLLGGVLVGDASEYGTLTMLAKSDMSLPCPPHELIVGKSGGGSPVGVGL